jgi:hypothetical protein
MEFRNVSGQGYSHCIFDTKTYIVYEIHVEVPETDQCFRWLNPDFKKAYYVEAESRDSNPNEAWDGVAYTHVDADELILEYLSDIGEEDYDNLPNFSTNHVMSMPGTMGGATVTFKEDEMKRFNVNLDVRFVLEVEAESMDEAAEKAKHFQETMKTGWGDHNNDVTWVDSYHVKESVEQELNI